MITNERFIHPIPTGSTAMSVARACYQKWRGLVTFEKDLVDYLNTGFVVARPRLFGMAKIIDLSDMKKTEGKFGLAPMTDFKGPIAKEPAWFIRIGVGRLDELLEALPFFLPKIAFCRRGDGRLRVYDLMKLTRLAVKQKGENWQ